MAQLLKNNSSEEAGAGSAGLFCLSGPLNIFGSDIRHIRVKNGIITGAIFRGILGVNYATGSHRF
ncbi:MAG: hypothetical protein NZ876_11210, partial [Dehalococcoidia bacterium]|nr:hypothetical protein [Dehalococcoidia bacterium]